MRFQPLAPIFKVEMPVLAWRSWHAKDENLVLKSTLNMGERGDLQKSIIFINIMVTIVASLVILDLPISQVAIVVIINNITSVPCP